MFFYNRLPWKILTTLDYFYLNINVSQQFKLKFLDVENEKMFFK